MDNKKSVQLDPSRLFGFKVYGQATLPQAKIGGVKKAPGRTSTQKTR